MYPGCGTKLGQREAIPCAVSVDSDRIKTVAPLPPTEPIEWERSVYTTPF